ncbi:hypothetical protein LMG33810_002525 [Carnimonas sp. LMG 33810]
MMRATKRGTRYARTAGVLCADPNFRLYLDRRARHKFGATVPDGTHTEDDAARWLRRACKVESRAAIDGNPSAVRELVAIRARFEHWKTSGY